MIMASAALCETKEEFREFIDNYNGELRVESRRAWDGDKLVAVIV